MGIRGLTSFVDGIPHLWTKIELKETRVIIDGSALLFYLHGNIDSHFGGQYDQFAQAIDYFFACFKANNVETYVVFDGPTVALDKKLETVVSRSRDSIQRCHNLFKAKATSYELVVPPLASILLVQKLQNLKIPFAFCDSEADKEVASLANQWKCPVISNDSDFFIYDIPAGYIPLSHIHYNKNSIRADLFLRRKLARHLEITETVLPLLASLLGNDFTGSKMLAILGKVFKLIDPTTSKKCTKKSLQIWSVSNHLRYFKTPDEALESIVGIIALNKEKATLEKTLFEALDEYEITNSNLEAYFNSGDTNTSLENIPTYVIGRYRHGNFPMIYMGVICSSRNILKCQVEDMKQVSSNNSCVRLRQIAYGILMPNSESIKEWDRDTLSLKKCKIQPLCDPIKDYGDLPTLKSLGEQDTDIRKLALVILQSNEAICSLPGAEQLFAASIHYWILHADPKVTKECVKILILQYLLQHETSTATPQSSKKKARIPVVDPVLLHSLAQWQAVMAECLHLNQILLDALPEPDLSTIFNGATAQLIKHELAQGKSLEDIVNPLDDFDRIHSAVTEGLDDSHWFAKKKKPKPKKPKGADIMVSSASNRFAALQLCSDSDEENRNNDDSDSEESDEK